MTYFFNNSVHLCAAPLLALVGAAVDPLRAGHVGHPVEGEGEDAVTAGVRAWTRKLYSEKLASKYFEGLA